MISTYEMDSVPIRGPWKLPQGWVWVPLGDICTINPARPRLSREGDAATSFIPMAQVDDITGTIKAVEIKSYAEVARGFTYFQENDVLFAKITPSMQNGKCAIARNLVDQFGFGSTEFHVIRTSIRVIPEWIHYFLRRLQFRLEAKEHFLGAVGQQRVPESFLATSLIPLPTSHEVQLRIVNRIKALLFDLQVAHDILEDMHRDINKVMNAASLEAFEEVAKSAKPVPLGAWTTKIGSGSTPRGADYVEEGIPFIRSLNVLWNKFSAKDLRFISATIQEQMRGTVVYIGDVLLNITGASIGRSCCAPEQFVPANVNQHVTIIRPKQELRSRFLMYWLTNPDTQQMISNMQSGATRQALTQNQIAQFQIPLPELTLQDYVVNYLDSIRQGIDGLQVMLQEDEEILQQVEQSILNQAFKGEL